MPTSNIYYIMVVAFIHNCAINNNNHGKYFLFQKKEDAKFCLSIFWTSYI